MILARPPTEPPTAPEYTRAGLRWFDYYGGDAEQPLGKTGRGKMTAAGNTRRCRRVMAYDVRTTGRAVAWVLALATAPMLAGCAESAAGRPDVSAALVQFGVAMLQPRPYGQTGLGHAAQALGEAGQAAARVREAEREREQREFEHALAERRVPFAALTRSAPGSLRWGYKCRFRGGFPHSAISASDLTVGAHKSAGL